MTEFYIETDCGKKVAGPFTMKINAEKRLNELSYNGQMGTEVLEIVSR